MIKPVGNINVEFEYIRKILSDMKSNYSKYLPLLFTLVYLFTLFHLFTKYQRMWENTWNSLGLFKFSALAIFEVFIW